MTKITYLLADEREQTVEAVDGESMMRTALQNDVPGIIGECGGELSCGTCHVYLEPDWLDKVAPRSRDEQEMLEMMDDMRPESRLSCQLRVSPQLDGLRARVAEQQ